MNKNRGMTLIDLVVIVAVIAMIFGGPLIGRSVTEVNRTMFHQTPDGRCFELTRDRHDRIIESIEVQCE